MDFAKLFIKRSGFGNCNKTFASTANFHDAVMPRRCYDKFGGLNVRCRVSDPTGKIQIVRKFEIALRFVFSHDKPTITWERFCRLENRCRIASVRCLCPEP